MVHSLRETLETEVQTHVEDYGDLIVQNIMTEIFVPASNLPDALPIDQVVATHDVMGAVDRYGADEGVLLAQKLRSLTVALQGTYTNEANVKFRYGFGFDNEPFNIERETNVDEGFGSFANRLTSDEVDNDTLYITSGKASAGYEDTAVGTGAGPESHIVDSETNYATEIGVLPEVTARESLFEYLYVISRSDQAPDDGTFRLYSNWQLYWLETDDEIEGRQIDILDD
jgi:hypothetical protein